MFGQVPLDFMMLMLLYAVGATTAAIASIYLFWRRGNAFAPDVTPPTRLRRWTAIFFACMALGHLWYLPTAIFTSEEDFLLSNLIGGLLDTMTILPIALVLLLCMLQDRRRPLWPVIVVIAPAVIIMSISIANRSYDLVPLVRVYMLLVGIGIVFYMMYAVWQYGRWLRDNYADLEHKEVWQSVLVLVVILLVFGIYIGGGGSDSDMAYEYIVQVCGILLIGYLLWRVETLSELQPLPLSQSKEPMGSLPEESPMSDVPSDVNFEQIESLLQQHCVDTQLYLQHDLTAVQLAQAIGSNRTYLSKYFARKNTTYNSYINSLRIQHFISLYRETTEGNRSSAALKLAGQCGYQSYSTFSTAFKQRMHKSVTAWMREEVLTPM